MRRFPGTTGTGRPKIPKEVFLRMERVYARGGRTWAEAARLVGISYSAYTKWKRRHRGSDL